MSTKISGRLKADQISIAKLTVDKLRDPPKMEVLAGLTDSVTGKTHGWLDQTSVVWSDETKRALVVLMACLEEDLARTHLHGDAYLGPPTEDSPGLRVPSEGLGEYLGPGDNTRSI
jgi:hypothetical protein